MPRNGKLLKQRAFIAAYAQTANMTAAAAAAKTQRSNHYKWVADDETYRRAFEAIQEEVGQTLEDEAVRRAHEGVKRPVLYKGVPVKQGRRILYEIEYSDQLLLALLKRFRPNLYRERTVTE